MDLSKGAIAIIIIFLFSSCTEKKQLTFEKFQFEIKGFDWEPKPYKFSSDIIDSIISNQGYYYAAWEYSYVGDIEKTLEMWDKEATASDTLSDQDIRAFSNFKRNNAKTRIINEAKNKSVIIINEAHHMPQHRVFTTELLQALYDEGYKHLGLESFLASHKSDSTLMANKYPVLSNGFYVKEPQYGNLIRQALKIGFKVFGYESMGHETPSEREINQAKNIEEYMASNPDEKYLIHCGFAHGTEGIYGGSWGKAMAGRLTEFTGTDPLTINQTTYSEKSNKIFENPFYRLTDVNEPSIYESNDSIFGQYREGSWFDISIFHPRTKNYNAPNWLLHGNRNFKKIDFANAEIECPCLIFAYLEGEEIGRAIPYSIKESNGEVTTLALEKGTYNIIILNKEGNSLMTNVKN